MIDIRITGYNKHTAGPLRLYDFSVQPLAVVTGKEDQFAHGVSVARSIILGLQAMDPLSAFEIREVNTAGNGAETRIDGESLFDIQTRMEKEELELNE